MKAVKARNQKEATFICLPHSGNVDRAHRPVPCLLIFDIFCFFLFWSFDEGLVVVTTQINRAQVQLYS